MTMTKDDLIELEKQLSYIELHRDSAAKLCDFIKRAEEHMKQPSYSWSKPSSDAPATFAEFVKWQENSAKKVAV